MTEEDQRELVILGKFQAIHSSMNTELPMDEKTRSKFLEAKRMMFRALDRHWDKCNSMLNKDDIKEPYSAT